MPLFLGVAPTAAEIFDSGLGFIGSALPYIIVLGLLGAITGMAHGFRRRAR